MRRLVIAITSPISVILIKGQLKYFRERSYRVYLIAPAHPDVAELCQNEGAVHLPVNFVREISPLHDVFALVKVFFLLMRIRPEIVNAGTPKASLICIIAARLIGIRKRVYTCRGFRFEHEKGFKRKILVVMEKLTGSLASDIICISPSIKSMAVKEGIFSKTKCVVIGQGSSNGIDLSTFSRDLTDLSQTEKDRQILGIGQRFVFGFVGRLIDRKGVGELVTAFASLKVNNPEMVLLMVGHPEMDQLSDPRVIEEIEHNPDIICIGWQADVARYLSLMDVFVLPAWWEGFGNVLIQAAAMGIPVISTKATGTRDAVQNGYNGILISPHNAQELAEVMELYYNDRALRKQHGENGICWARGFESTAIWSGIDKIYNNVVLEEKDAPIITA